jgi:hypothetical protein
MDEKDIIKKLESARLKELPMAAAKAHVKNALLSGAVLKQRQPVFSSFRYAALLAAVFAASVATYYVIDNMEEGRQFNKNGGVWSTYSDAQEGGNSVIWPAPSSASQNEFVMSAPGFGDTGYAVRVTGRTGNKFDLNYNYLGLVNRFSNDTSCPKCDGVNIKKYKGIMFRVKGKVPSGNILFVLPHESQECVPDRLTCKSLTGYADYEKDITNEITDKWTTVMIDFRKDLMQPYWTPAGSAVPVEKVLESVHLFKWQYKNGSGDLMELWIDDVQLYL